MYAPLPIMPSYRGTLEQWQVYLREIEKPQYSNFWGIEGAIAEARGMVRAIKAEESLHPQPLAA